MGFIIDATYYFRPPIHDTTSRYHFMALLHRLHQDMLRHRSVATSDLTGFFASSMGETKMHSAFTVSARDMSFALFECAKAERAVLFENWFLFLLGDIRSQAGKMLMSHERG